ncbi:hypothetical protein MLD38_021031 [Melastoma candidum]|uniref:Uncharacterized protein n=1 Tax=Melastoma candidum TaxID=119954 RepID=A0ACB9QEU9_9MYRT|nr:hypothetical protein MLD38_021031 [Melastoma candidum]
MAYPRGYESPLPRSHDAMQHDGLRPSSAPPLWAPPPGFSSFPPSRPHLHPHTQHQQFLRYPPLAPPYQDDDWFNHMAVTYCADDPVLMAFLTTPIEDFGGCLNFDLGSGIHQDSGISKGDLSNVCCSGADDSSCSVIGNTMAELPSSRLHRGRHLVGDTVYDIDKSGAHGDVQLQLEVTTITKYASNPGLVLGRQIAVNRSYICYGLKTGNIRVLNLNTASRSLLCGHTQRITDMAFFCDDVHILASASSDGRVVVWKINEGLDKEDKAQTSGYLVAAIQIIGEEETVHPRLCWHPNKQEVLMVALGNRIFKVDTNKAVKKKSFSAEEPLKCPANKLLKGVQIVGKHDALITDLSMCQMMPCRLASASTDGVVKIWEENKPLPVATLRPYDGRSVSSVTFVTAPHRPDHIVLFTGGPLNREIKIWTSAHEDGRLLSDDLESWQCIQTLELKSSSEERVEDVFFNKIVAVPLAGIILLANAKRNALYAVLIEYGQGPISTRMEYLAEFTVAMPILSLTVTSQSQPHGQHIVQVYCMQTRAIQQYTLASSRYLPSILDPRKSEKAFYDDFHEYDSLCKATFGEFEGVHGMEPNTISCSATLVPPIFPSTVGSTPTTVQTVHVPFSEVIGFPEVTTVLETEQTGLSYPVRTEQVNSSSPPLLPSPRLSQRSSGFRSPPSCLESNITVTDHKIGLAISSKMDVMKGGLADRHSPSSDMCKDNRVLVPTDMPVIPDPPMIFKPPTHLVTPSEILSRASSSTQSQKSETMGGGDSNVSDVINVVLEKVVGEEATSQNNVYDFKEGMAEKSFSQAPDISIHVARDFGINTCRVEGAHLANNIINGEQPNQLPSQSVEAAQHFKKNDYPMLGVSEKFVPLQLAAPPAEVTGRTGTASQPSGPSSQSESLFNSTDSSNDPSNSSRAPSGDATYLQLSSMQEMLDQLVRVQNEMSKQMTAIVSLPFNREGQRLEASLGRNLENIVKANEDAFWARFLEENAKQNKLEQEHTQNITSLINNCLKKGFPSILEKTIKNEISSIGPAVVCAASPIIKNSISSAIAASFQKALGDKAFNHLEKGVSSKLEDALAQQIQLQFQTTGKLILQDSLRACLETSLVPAFELSCKALFERVDVTVQNGLEEHIVAMQQLFDSAHSPLAISLRDVLKSVSSTCQVLSGELADGQRTLMAIANAYTRNKGANMMVDVPVDLTIELSRLLAQNKYEEAFAAALHKNDLSIVSWLCAQVDFQKILSANPLPLSQGVLVALLQQLACDVGKETSKKVQWMTEVAIVINSLDPTIRVHVRPICDQVYQILNHQQQTMAKPSEDASNIRLLMHVISSLLASYK